MKNLRYILKDYAKIKKSKRVKHSMLKKSIVIISFLIFVLAAYSAVINDFKLFIIAVFIFIPIFLLAINLDSDSKYLSMFGTLKELKEDDNIEEKVKEANEKRNEDGKILKAIKEIHKENNCFFIKSIADVIEKILQEDAELMRKQSDEMADAVPEWFEYFLGEKGVNPGNIDLLIDELSVKYEYPLMKSALKGIVWIIAFIGIDHIKEFPWHSYIFSLGVYFMTVSIIFIIYFLESNRFLEKSSLHPLLHIKKNKEELLHDLKLMKMKWNAQEYRKEQ